MQPSWQITATLTRPAQLLQLGLRLCDGHLPPLHTDEVDIAAHHQGIVDTPCKTMVLLRLGTRGCLGRARVMLWMQWTVTACTLLWLVATRNTAHIFGGGMLFKLGRGFTQLTECSWADKLHLSWQLSLPLQLSWQRSWQVAAELTDYSSANMMQLRWQVSSELTGCSWADVLQTSWQLSWRVAAGLTSCSWADINSSKSSSNGTEKNRLQLLWLVKFAENTHTEIGGTANLGSSWDPNNSHLWISWSSN